MKSSPSSSKKIKICGFGLPHDYRLSLIPLIIQSLGYSIDWVESRDADLIVYGPFHEVERKKLRWVPKGLRGYFNLFDLKKNSVGPLTLFHTQENVRHDSIRSDFSISFDLSVSTTSHYRLPYWMELVDWSSEGIFGNINPRYGKLLCLKKLMMPIENSFLNKPSRAVLFASHLKEPRKTVCKAVSRYLQLDGMGSAFDMTIKNHHESGFSKYEVLQNYQFNLCPENSIYPGYVTEKIPEAFMANSLPISWVDMNVGIDFNPNAFINLYPSAASNYEDLLSQIHNDGYLKSFLDQPLLTSRPTLEPLKVFIKEVIKTAIT